tara:strand:+ start:2268 stop:2519 length:252 start_codon:yes stop_codon:yes gene_type:complete
MITLSNSKYQINHDDRFMDGHWYIEWTNKNGVNDSHILKNEEIKKFLTLSEQEKDDFLASEIEKMKAFLLADAARWKDVPIVE